MTTTDLGQAASISNATLESSTDGCSLASGDKVGRPATYDDVTGTYKHMVNIQDSSSFCIRTYTITSGALKGCRTIILVPAGSFRLLDLPGEIRNMIYKCVVMSPNMISLETYHPKGHGERVVQTSFKRKDHKTKAQHTKKFEVPGPNSDTASLLLVNHQIHDEAVEVLYGHNTFSFDLTDTLKLFIKINGKCLPYLRFIELDCFWHLVPDKVVKTLKAAQRAMWRAPGLRKVQIKHHAVCSSTSLDAEAFVDVFAPLLQKIQNFKQAQGINSNMTELLEFPACSCDDCARRKAGIRITPFARGPCAGNPKCVSNQTDFPQQVKEVVAKKFPAKE